MKIVIDISRIEYDKIKENDCRLFNGRYFDMIRNGTPLRCVLDEMRREIKEYTFKAYGTKFIYIDRLNHIINKAESEESNGTL